MAADVLRGEKRLQASNTTTWNSQLKMIRSVLSVSESKLAELGEAPKLTSHERNILRDIMEILIPFEEATDFVQIGCVPSAGYVLPCIQGLNHHVQGMVSKYHSTFVQALKQSLRKRIAYYEEKEVYITAAILDPQFKLQWCFNETEKKEFTEMITSALERSVPATVSTVSTEDNTDPPPSKRAKSLFSFMPEPSVQSESQSTSFTNELDNYLQSSCVLMEVNPTEFWKKENTKYPHLSKLAKKVLGEPSSSAPVEHLFSIAGKLFRPEHCNLKDSRFEELMFVIIIKFKSYSY